MYPIIEKGGLTNQELSGALIIANKNISKPVQKADLGLWYEAEYCSEVVRFSQIHSLLKREEWAKVIDTIRVCQTLCTENSDAMPEVAALEAPQA
jgi:hypothetical protein